MTKIRLISRLDVKGPNLIKGVQLEGLRVIGDPNLHAINYFEQGADEIIYLDSVASLYGRNHLSSLVEKTCEKVFIPITVGGGIRSLNDAKVLLRSGADKVSINTAAVKNPNLIKEIINDLGSQSLVLSIEAKQTSEDNWEVFVENGREPTGINILNWIEKVQILGVGEILLTSIDREGTRKGFDINLVKHACKSVDIPIIISGGMGCLRHFSEICNLGLVDAVAIADVLHYKTLTIFDIKKYAKENNIDIRIK